MLKFIRISTINETQIRYIKTPQKQQPIKPYYEVNVNNETGECSQSYYDGELIMQVKGLWFAGKSVITRLYNWRLEQASFQSAKQLS